MERKKIGRYPNKCGYIVGIYVIGVMIIEK